MLSCQHVVHVCAAAWCQIVFVLDCVCGVCVKPAGGIYARLEGQFKSTSQTRQSSEKTPRYCPQCCLTHTHTHKYLLFYFFKSCIRSVSCLSGSADLKYATLRSVQHEWTEKTDEESKGRTGRSRDPAVWQPLSHSSHLQPSCGLSSPTPPVLLHPPTHSPPLLCSTQVTMYGSPLTTPSVTHLAVCLNSEHFDFASSGLCESRRVGVSDCRLSWTYEWFWSSNLDTDATVVVSSRETDRVQVACLFNVTLLHHARTNKTWMRPFCWCVHSTCRPLGGSTSPARRSWTLNTSTLPQFDHSLSHWLPLTARWYQRIYQGQTSSVIFPLTLTVSERKNRRVRVRTVWKSWVVGFEKAPASGGANLALPV